MLMLAFFKIIMFSLTIKIIDCLFVLIDLTFQPFYDFQDLFQIRICNKLSTIFFSIYLK